MKKNYSTFFFLLASLISSAQFTWTVKDTVPAPGRRFAGGFSVNGMGYIVSGETAKTPYTLTNEVWQYNPTADSWTPKSNFPYSTAGSSAFVINDTGYVVGGSNSGAIPISTGYSYNSTSDIWMPITNFPENGVSEAFQFVINGLGYVGTGARANSNTSSTMYSYNPSTNTWAQAASFTGLQGINMSSFSIDSFGYAGLGQDGGSSFYNEFYKYNPANNSWTQIASFPGKARAGASAFVLGGKAYVGGGIRLTSGSCPYALSDFYEYDPATNTWTAVPGFPGAPREEATSIVINNVSYSICGEDDDGELFYNFVSEFSECSKVTTGITPTTGNTKALIEIYPNPSTSDVTVKITNAITDGVKYQIVSVDGKLVKSGSTAQNTFGFSTNNLSNGLYILTVTDNKGLQGEKHFEVIH